MDRRRFLQIQAVLTGIGALAGGCQGEASLPPPKPRRGVSLAGAEFGTQKKGFSCRSPGAAGSDYTYNSESTVKYFAGQGFTLLRIPFRWERVQPQLGGELQGEELRRLRQVVGWAEKHHCQVILDVHNYGRYTAVVDDKPVSCVIDQQVGGQTPVSRSHFADLWRRLSRAFRDEPAVYAYGLMNEPHDMGRSSWKRISQAAVDAIRKEEDERLVLVAGDGWSSAATFAKTNGPAWIKDAAGKVAYEAHCYFDHDGSGHYAKSYAAERAADPNLARRPAERLRAFVSWCQENKAAGFVGEFGVPGNDEGWLDLMRSFIGSLDEAGMSGCYWAAGEWWANYVLSLQPRKGYRQHAPQLAVLKT
jgi:endoglucanase